MDMEGAAPHPATKLNPGEFSVGDALPVHNVRCMVCGVDSGQSPLLRHFFVASSDAVAARVRFDERHQGAPHYAHGGAVAALLDDACGYVAYLVSKIFVTAHLEIDYRRPVLLGAEYDVLARCTLIEGRKVQLAADLLDGDTPVAQATGLFIEVELDHFQP